jgi:hypothetical protein
MAHGVCGLGVGGSQAEVEAVVEMYTQEREEELLGGNPVFVLDAIDNIDTKVGRAWAGSWSLCPLLPDWQLQLFCNSAVAASVMLASHDVILHLGGWLELAIAACSRICRGYCAVRQQGIALLHLTKCFAAVFCT